MGPGTWEPPAWPGIRPSTVEVNRVTRGILDIPRLGGFAGNAGHARKAAINVF